jgi:hypothetical protein
LWFVSAVRRVDMVRSCMTILTSDGRLHVFDLNKIHRIQSIYILCPGESLRALSTLPNASLEGSFYALSRVDDEAWLVCKSTEDVGTLRVFNGPTMELINPRCKAHDHNVSRIAIGGTKGQQRCATASQQVRRSCSIKHGLYDFFLPTCLVTEYIYSFYFSFRAL